MLYFKNKVQFILAVLILSITPLNVAAQNPDVEGILDKVHLDSLVLYVQQFSGAAPIEIGGKVDTIFSRHYEHKDNEKSFLFLKEQLTRIGYPIDSQQFSEFGKNLIGVKEGTVYPDQYFLIGAHYDSKPAGDISPGANDNGSGMAAVLEAARVLSEINFPYTIKFIFFDEEEIGLKGSQAFARSIGSNQEKMLGYINLDMIAWDGDDDGLTEIHVRDIAKSVQLAEIVLKCNTDYQIGLNLQLIQPGGGMTDHASFWNVGQTAVGINEVYMGVDTYPYIHTVADTIGHFNLPYFLKNTKLAIATLAELAYGENTVVSTDERVSIHDLLVYPNPFSSEIYISFKGKTESIEKISLLDEQGKVHFQESNLKSTSVFLPKNLPTGIYFLHIKVGEKRWLRKMYKN